MTSATLNTYDSMTGVVTAGATADVVIAGGGIAGTAIANELARAGARVVLVERHGVAAGATSAAAGVISLASKAPGPLARLARASLPLFPALSAEVPVDVRLRQVGSLFVYETEEERRAVLDRVTALKADGIELELLPVAEARRLQPLLGDGFLGAAHAPQDSIVDSGALARGLAELAAQRGAEIAVGEEVTGVTRRGDRLESVLTDRRAIGCRWLVNAAGPWSAQLGERLGRSHPVVPRRGQLVALAPMAEASAVRVATARGIFAKQAGSEAGWFSGPALTPAVDGRLVLGGSNEDAGFAPGVDPVVIATIVLRACRLFPGLAGATVVGAWSGLRPHSLTGAPILGADPELRGYVVATGQGGDGIAIAPAIGRYVAELICGRRPDLTVEEFLSGSE
jgi:sarcosine oxidase subunit beta